MPAEKFRVLIPTTSGPVEILLLTEEDPAIGRSVACIGGTTETADIAAAYHAFVARPTGLIERLFGHSCYRLDVSGRIDAGTSWQLGILAAHSLHAADRLAQEKDSADGVIWATGSVRPVDLTIGGVGHLPEKLEHSLARLKQEVAAGRRVLMAVPASDAAIVSAALEADPGTGGIELIALSDARPLCDRLGVTLPEGRGAATDLVAARPDRPARRAGPWRIWGAAAAALLCVATAAIYLVVRSPAPVADAEPKGPPTPREAEALVPETVPFISARDQAMVRQMYLPAPDHKALALSGARVGFSTAQPTQETAEAAALAACQRITAESARVRTQCELYAIGNVVVSSRGHPPMPPHPWVIRNPSIERPFAPEDIPLVPDTARQAIDWAYVQGPKSKAMALADSGTYTSYVSETSVEEAVRRALERCGSNAGTACTIVAIDDVFVVPIPRTAKVVGFYRPGRIAAIAPELRESVARRLGNATSGWNAVAVGASGRVGAGIGAQTERAAVDAAMAECGRQDRDCRIVVIGPFLVEPDPSAPPPVAATDPAQSAGTKSPDTLPETLASAIPELAAAAREDLVGKYEAAKPHKALAVVPGTALHWRASGWTKPAAAEEAVLERCQVFYAQPCALVAIDDKAAVTPAERKWPVHDMPRATYAGAFDPQKIPGVSQTVRERPDIVQYRDVAGPKAVALHPRGSVFTTLVAESQHAAEASALAACNADPARQGQDGPCQLYAAGNQVILPQRRFAPAAPEGTPTKR